MKTLGIALACLPLAACGHVQPAEPVCEQPPPRAAAPRISHRIEHRVDRERVRYLEREITRLRADLLEAEDALVAIESVQRGPKSRADAVSAVAEARIAVDRAGGSAPWRRTDLGRARAKLEEAERQLQADHPGSAIFFASRARDIAASLDREAARVADTEKTRYVDSEQVNLRAGPSMRRDVILTLERDTPVFPEHRHGSWVLVRTSAGPLGWVHKSLLRAP